MAKKSPSIGLTPGRHDHPHWSQGGRQLDSSIDAVVWYYFRNKSSNLAKPKSDLVLPEPILRRRDCGV